MVKHTFMLFLLLLFAGTLSAQIAVPHLSDPDELLTDPEAKLFTGAAIDSLPGKDVAKEGTLVCGISAISRRTEADMIGVELLLSCSYIDSEGRILFQETSIPALGVGFDRFEALRSAADDFRKQISALFRQLPGASDGRLLSRQGNVYVISATAFDSLQPGDEMESQGDRSALLLVEERFGSAVFAVPVYGDPSRAVQFSPISRKGLDTEVYGGIFISSEGIAAPVAGFRIRISPGSARMYPFVGLETMPGKTLFSQGDVIFPYLGLQYVWYLGRFTFSPLGGLGIGSFLNGSDPMKLSYAGGFGGMEIAFRGGRSFSLFLDGGYGSWIDLNGIADDGSYGYNGVRAVCGFRWKF